MNHTNFLIVLVTIVLGAGCASEPDTGSWSETPLSDHQAALKEHTPEAISVLAWLNGLDATFDVLDNAVGLYSNTARNIVAHVRGPDGALGTRDDNPLDTIAELDAISRVGPRAMARILDYVEAIGGIRVEDVEGHTLTQAQVDRILEIVNHFSRDALDFEIGLDKRAANNLVASRPFEAMDQIAEVSYVGPAAILQLREYADRRRPGAEDIVVEGVVFTPPQAAEVVMLANLATRAQLDEEARLDARAALHIIAARDIGSVSELGQVKYVGKSALRKLRD